ncbi:hypothetical protein [Nocardia tengchongensis]|uniref:hypothetical protein n=1 Tax=Nocardia tengchongensis TaxID=2055889 RepID=UPI00360DE293
MRHRLGQATDAAIHATWPWLAALVGNWVLYASGVIVAPQMLAAIVIMLSVCGAIGVVAALWLVAALITDFRIRRAALRREARRRHPSSGRWVRADWGIGKPSAGDELPALGDLPNP